MDAVKQALFEEMNKSLMGLERPSEYFQSMRNAIFEFEHPFNMLSRLRGVKQSPKYHPEGSVWNHTMMVIDEAASHKQKAKDAGCFMWAALLHDIGKAVTTKENGGKITAYDHDKAGARMTREFLLPFETETFIKEVCSLVRWHMQILYASKSMHFAELERMKREADILDVALLGLCDRLGRGEADRAAEEKSIERFLKRMSQ